MILSGPGRSGGDEPGVEAIGGCVHKRRALNTRLSSGTSAGTSAVSAGPYRNYHAEAGTKNEPDTFFVPIQKTVSKIDSHVSNLGSRKFLFQGVLVHPYSEDLIPGGRTRNSTVNNWYNNRCAAVTLYQVNRIKS